MEYKYISKSEEDTVLLAENIEAERFENMIICLDGDLGSGKTVFTKAFANAMGIRDVVTSPTFNIIKEYHGETSLYHMDVYRLDGNITEIGIEEYFRLPGVIIIEWSEMIKDFLPKERLEIKIKTTGENTRVFDLIAYGEKYEEVCDKAI